MFLRANRRLVGVEWYAYWTLVKAVRMAKGPRQEIVATLGKEPGLDGDRSADEYSPDCTEHPEWTSNILDTLNL